MKREESEDVKKLRLEMEYRNYSLNSVKTYCDLMSFLELSLSKKLEEITIEDLKGFNYEGYAFDANLSKGNTLVFTR